MIHHPLIHTDVSTLDSEKTHFSIASFGLFPSTFQVPLQIFKCCGHCPSPPSRLALLVDHSSLFSILLALILCVLRKTTDRFLLFPIARKIDERRYFLAMRRRSLLHSSSST